MSFNYSPYEPKLKRISAQLASTLSAQQRYAIDTSCLFEYADNDPVAAISPDQAKQIPRRVGIIGAGIAGLTAAYEFLRLAQRFGRPEKISIFEKTARIGGRILTHQFNQGAYAELGPMRLPAYHKIALHYADELQVKLHTFPGNRTYHFSRIAQTTPHVDPAGAGRALAESYRQFSASGRPALHYFFPPEGAGLPSIDQMEAHFINVVDELLPQNAAQRVNAVKKLDLFANRPLSDWGKALESWTVREGFIHFVEFKGGSLPVNAQPYIAACAEYLWELLGRATGMIWLEHISMAHFMREVSGFSGGDAKFAIAGGFSRLTDAFVDRLKAGDRVSFNLRHSVMGVELLDEAVRLHCAGAPEPYEARDFDAVICAAPASAVARIHFQPRLDTDKHNALSSISYLAASKSAALFRERFWELAEPAQLGGATLTDMENQQLWYPHDNIQYDDRKGPEVPFEGMPSERVRRVRAPYQRENIDVSKGPGAILAAYIWGENARRFASLTGLERDDHIIRCLETVHPGSSKQLIDLVHWPWDAQTNPGGGAFAWYQPGQQSRYQEAATRPHPTAAPRVFFAGEHLGLIQGWIQAAMITALDAVMRACGAR